MSCRLDIKNAIYKSIRENVENNKKIIPRNTYQFVRDNLIKINSEADNSNTKVKSDEWRRQQARKIAVSIATAITKIYKKNVYFTIDSSKQFKPVTVLMTLNPAYVEHEYRKLPLSEQTDPLDFNPPAALNNEGVGINKKRNTTDYFVVPKYFSEGTTTTSKAILEKIANSSHPLASVAKALIPYDVNSTIELISKSSLNGGAATYNSNTHKIEIAKFASFRGLGVEPTLIHEILHAITVRYIEANPNSKEVKDLFALFAHSRQYKVGMEDDYGFTNLKEFIVAIFTDAEFVKTLSTKPPFEKIGKYSNAFEEIMDYILSLFKFRKPQKSLYMQAFDIATHIVQNGKAYNDAQAEVVPNEAFFTNMSEDEEYSNLSSNKAATTPIKEGVEDLFESNPELANQVYEALGFKERNQVGENPFNTVVNFDLNKIRAVSGKLGEQGATPDGIRNLLKYVGVDLTNVNTDSTKAMADYLRSNPSERNKVLELVKQEPIKLSQLPDGSYDLKDGNHRATILYYSGIESIPAIITNNTGVVKVTEEYIGPFGGISPTQETITPQQKQQALQVYSQYLDTAQNQVILPSDKIVFGHPTIGKSYLKKQGEDKFITLDDDYADEVNAFIDAKRGSETRQEYKGRKPKEYNEFMLNLFDRLKIQAKKEGKRLFVSNTNILKERMSEFDKVINIPKDEFKKRFDARGATYGFEDWKSDIDATIAKVPNNKVINTDKYLSDLFLGSKQDIEGFKKFTAAPSKVDEKGQGLLFNLASPEINYQLKAISIINKNLSKIQQWEKQIKDSNTLWNKIQKDLQVPSAQIELLKNSEGSSIEDKLVSFSANYSYTIEINIAKEKKDVNSNIREFTFKGIDYSNYNGFKKYLNGNIQGIVITKEEYEEALNNYNNSGSPAQHYSNLTVPGGTNYTENEISTPLITPSIKGHAQFSTDKGIGWFRSDEQVLDGSIDKSTSYQPTGNFEEDAQFFEGIDGDGFPMFKSNIVTKNGNITKTRRILEVQSDLFQKGRDRNDLTNGTTEKGNLGQYIKFEYSGTNNYQEIQEYKDLGWEQIKDGSYAYNFKRENKNYIENPTIKQNQFLQLLNKDNNWVTFFVKSIVQDSAKKGYEKVLFPSGNTASKVEGHTTLEEFKKQKEDRIKELEKTNFGLKNKNTQNIPTQLEEGFGEYVTNRFKTKEEADNFRKKNNAYHYDILDNINENEINQLKQELERVETEGFGALRPIYNFYETQVKNILSKTYNVKTITDEYGNTWNEIAIDPVRDASPIVFSLPQQQYNKYQTEANEETIEKVKTLLAKLGVSVEITDKVMEEFGANALIDLSRRLIQMVEGKESESLTEEAMHLLTALLPQDILADLLSKITSYQIYKDTFNQYKNHPAYQNADGTPNIDKIKFEAVGKLLAEFYIGRAQNLSIDEINAAKSVWSRILDWIKNIFSRQMNEFEKVIQGLENGTLTLLSTPSRQDKFLNVTFAKVEAEKLTGILTNGAVNTDITENASTPNAKILYAISQQIDRIAAEDSKKLNSFKQAFSYMNKQAFSEATLKLNNAKEIEELKERAYNAISYYSSLGNISIAMTDRARSIRVQYKAGVNKAGEALSDDEKLYMSLEIDKMDRAAEIYIKELEEFRILFIDSDLEPFAKSIANTTKEFTSLLANNENVKIDMLKDVLAKGLKGKLEGYLKDKKKRELELIRMIPSLTGKEKINKQKELQEVQKNIATPPFSVNSIIADIMGPGNGKSLQGISDWVDRMMAGGKTIKNEAAQLVASVLEDVNRDSRKQAEISMSEMQKIFEDAKIKLGITGTEYDRFIEAVTRYQIKETSTGKELAVYEEYVLLSGLQQWKYENQMEVISYLKWAANAGKTEEEMNQIFERVFARKLTDAEKNNYPATFKNIQKELYDVYGQSKYTQEYKDVQAILETAVLSTGKTVKSVRQEYIDKIKKRSNDLEEAITPEQILTALDEKNIALKELQLLSSTYKNGVKKTGDELIVAQTINRWAKEKKDKEIDEYYLSNQNKVRWDEAKERVDKLAINDPERVAWYAANTATEISQDYYDRQEDVSTKLANLFNRIKPKTLKDKERIDDLYYDLRQLTKGKRDGNGVVVGSEFNDEEVKIIKEIELALKEIRDIANESSEEISKEDKAEMNRLLAELEDIQTKSLTEYWDDALEVAMMQIDANLSVQEQDEALQKSNFIKNNTINVTDKYTASTFKKPDNIIQIGNKYYQPLTIWQHTTPSAEFKTIVSPSFKWKTYKVNDNFRNLNHETNQGNVALNNSTESIQRFGSKRHDLLTTKDKEFLSNLTNFYLKLQQDHPQYERMNLSIPRLQAEGALRAKQRLVNSKTLFSGITTKAYWENIVNLTPTEKETQYGEGLNIDQDRLNVNSKFIGNHIPLKRQEKDLYKIFGTYAAETARAKSMRRVVPVLNTLKKIQNKDNPINKNINYEINKRVNMKNRLDKGIMRSISNWSDIAMGGLGFTRLGTPWLLTSTIKNTAVGLWNIAVNNSYLRKFSKGSILIAVKRAMKTATIVSTNEFSSNPPKELAIIRRLSILSGKTMLETANLNKDFLLKAAMATGYGMSALRKWSEMHLELTMYELIKMQYKIETGRELLDEYDYVNNQLTPKNITSEKENEITKQSENMNFYTHGNFRGDNSPLAKAYFLGRALLFMKGYIYNPSIKRIGSKRLISTGEEMEGFYKIFWRVVKQSPTSVLTHLSSKDNYFSAEEKSAVWAMYKDFAFINVLGGALYLWAQALKESGDDDDDAPLEWYGLLLSRKIYQEMSWANPADLIGKPLSALLSEDSQRNKGGQIESLLYYTAGRPAMDLVAQTIIPIDYKGLRFEEDDIKKNKDPFYSQFKDNWILFDLMKSLKMKGDMFYPQSSLSGFEYFDRSIYQYEKEERGQRTTGSRKKRKSTRRKD